MIWSCHVSHHNTVSIVMYMFACGAQLPTDCAETARARETRPLRAFGRARVCSRLSRLSRARSRAPRPRAPAPAVTQNETRSHCFRMQVLASATARPRAVGALAGHSRAATARRRAPALSRDGAHHQEEGLAFRLLALLLALVARLRIHVGGPRRPPHAPLGRRRLRRQAERTGGSVPRVSLSRRPRRPARHG